MKYGLYEDRRLAAAALARGEISRGGLHSSSTGTGSVSGGFRGAGSSFGGGFGSGYGGGYDGRRREDYVPSNRPARQGRRNFFQRAGDYLREYGSTAGRIGFVSMFPIGFAAGFGGTFIYDSGKFAYDAILYLANSFPNYSFADVFRGAWNYVASVPLDALVTGIKDGVVAGLGGSLITSYIKRKLFGK
jgi:hypothetical protein